MGSSQAFFDSYAGVEVAMPDGSTLELEPLRLDEGAKFFRLLLRSRMGDPEAMLDILDEFPKAVGAEKELQALLPAELFDVVDDFLSRKRPGVGVKPAPQLETATDPETGPKTPSSTSASTT